MKTKTKNLLSVIVPTFNQDSTIVDDVKNIIKILDQTRFDYEVIVVFDGWGKKTTVNKLKRLHAEKLKVIGFEHNHGKGYAVRFGMAKAKGEMVAFIDAGGDLDPNGISMLLEHMFWYKADIIVGSKLHPASKVSYPFERRILSFFSRIWIWLLFGLKVRDTQTGLKVFKREVLERVLPRLLVKEFAFDVEILAVSRHLGFSRIYEAPIELNYNFQSSIMTKSFFSTLFHTFLDTLAICYRLYFRRYYDDSNMRRWRYDPELNFKVNIG